MSTEDSPLYWKEDARLWRGKVDEWDDHYIDLLPKDIKERMDKETWEIPDTEARRMGGADLDEFEWPPLKAGWLAVSANKIGEEKHPVISYASRYDGMGWWTTLYYQPFTGKHIYWITGG